MSFGKLFHQSFTNKRVSFWDFFFLYSVPFPLSPTQLLSYIKSYGNVPGAGGMSDGCKEGLQLKCLLCLPKSALCLQLPSVHLLMICKTRASTYQQRLLVGTHAVFVMKVWGTAPVPCEDYRCFACPSHHS